MEDDEYVSDELDNSDPDESDDEKGEGPKFEKFRKKKLNKDYQFKWGMEFNSLTDFRDAILGHQHTHAIKTLADTHTCARVLNNISANSKWVAKAVVKKMQTQIDTVRIRDIMQDMRQHFSLGFTVAREWLCQFLGGGLIMRYLIVVIGFQFGRRMNNSKLHIPKGHKIEPDATQLDAIQIDATQPDVTQPDVTQADATQPGAT
ncbi:hypothetical protein KIW84_064240 [Lathyrus oleraceus]|uniref:Uncharacterized protein n=1 Tax=Pisum sativum TaxID=3888 RepID=A0A9D5A8E7_PEA|nr:hypothetical protein KIW84_064240 [Pisum sativum]